MKCCYPPPMDEALFPALGAVIAFGGWFLGIWITEAVDRRVRAR